MSKIGLVFANLFHKKTRTLLTLLSVLTAFLLFGLLQAIHVLFYAGADFVGATRLVTQSRVSFTSSLPLRMLPELDALPGVAAVTHIQWFGGVLGENEQIVAFVTDPLRLRAVYPEWVLPDAQWQAFANTRTGMIAGRVLADKYGWKVGQKIPLKSNIYPNSDGSKNWAFDLVGIYDGKDEEWRRRASSVYINYAYFNEVIQFGKNQAGIYVLRLEDPDMAGVLARTIDSRYENSSDETKTQTEKDFNLSFAKQIGDIGLIVGWILFAVFFTLLLVVGNTMAQSVRERIPQFAVLKTLGFSDLSVLKLVLAETALLCTLGGVLGLSLATAIGILVQKNAGVDLPLSVDARVWMAGLIAMLVLSLAVGLLPALRAQRLNIVDALAGR